MRLQVHSIISEKSFGSIFSARLIGDEGGSPGGLIRVRASTTVLYNAPSVGETWEVDGEFSVSAWGPQLEASTARRLLPSGKLIIRFLVSKVPGVGMERAQRLWNAYGGGLAAVLRDEGNIPSIANVIAPERPNLGPRLAAALVREWKDASFEADIFDWLSGHCIQNFSLARRIARILGDSAIERLTSNPYILVSMVEWRQIDHLGLKLLNDNGVCDPRSDVRRFVGAADSVIRAVLSQGSTAVSKSEFQAMLAEQLGLSANSRTLSSAIEAGVRNQAIVSAGNLWRAPGCATMEAAVLQRLKRFLEDTYPAPSPNFTREDIRQAIQDVDASGSGLHAGQKAAAMRILNSPLACLQGGAGVGKTHTIRAICDAFEAMGGNVLLCALSGKAALKLSRATSRLARTLARTLRDLDSQDTDGQAQPFADHGGNPPAQLGTNTLVVIDEASMVDLSSFHQLLQHMSDGARLLLVGDTAQLPPVGFGLIYHLLATDELVTSTITHVFRQAAETGVPAAATDVKLRREPRLNRFLGMGQGVSFIDATSNALANKVIETYLALGGHTADALIVTATNAGVAGVQALNSKLHKFHVEMKGLDEIKGYGGTSYAVGEPVIYLRNRYDLGLFNGSMGIIQHIDCENRRLTVLFDGEVEPHILGSVDIIDLDLAYAVTCHKCQGSQARRVIIPVYRTRIIEPSWLYTAMTRAEEQVVFVGDRNEMSTAVQRPLAATQRTIGLVWRKDAPENGAGKENRTPLASLEG